MTTATPPPPALRAEALTRRYGRRTALDEVTLTVPRGRIVGLVGPNGAGKSTLLHLACGLLQPTSGSLEVLGARPAATAEHLARVGFVAQDTPVYRTLTVAEHLRMGAKLNPSWDEALAERRIARARLDPAQKAGRLSGGQRAQLALTVAAAKRPELLIFDEPAAALDPLARQGFLESLVEFVGELGSSAVLSSHLLGDIQRACDHLIVLCAARVQVSGDVRDLLSVHHRLTAPPGGLGLLPPGVELIHRDEAGGVEQAVVRAVFPPAPSPWRVGPVSLEELVLAYMTRAQEREGR